ncbi:hypothetical protein BKA62DRAFT_670445 [Auriculariales sp. MPI-PUGE-AT-0066]|nr:hypothetical protein BKA62DRAFT_670445 [Auriculariales sp. MPI-PUGE-AT-0066]
MAQSISSWYTRALPLRPMRRSAKNLEQSNSRPVVRGGFCKLVIVDGGCALLEPVGEPHTPRAQLQGFAEKRFIYRSRSEKPVNRGGRQAGDVSQLARETVNGAGRVKARFLEARRGRRMSLLSSKVWTIADGRWQVPRAAGERAGRAYTLIVGGFVEAASDFVCVSSIRYRQREMSGGIPGGADTSVKQVAGQDRRRASSSWTAALGSRIMIHAAQIRCKLVPLALHLPASPACARRTSASSTERLSWRSSGRRPAVAGMPASTGRGTRASLPSGNTQPPVPSADAQAHTELIGEIPQGGQHRQLEQLATCKHEHRGIAWSGAVFHPRRARGPGTLDSNNALCYGVEATSRGTRHRGVAHIARPPPASNLVILTLGGGVECEGSAYDRNVAYNNNGVFVPCRTKEPGEEAGARSESAPGLISIEQSLEQVSISPAAAAAAAASCVTHRATPQRIAQGKKQKKKSPGTPPAVAGA